MDGPKAARKNYAAVMSRSPMGMLGVIPELIANELVKAPCMIMFPLVEASMMAQW